MSRSPRSSPPPRRWARWSTSSSSHRRSSAAFLPLARETTDVGRGLLSICVAIPLALAGAPAANAAAPLGLTDCGPSEGGYQCSGLVRAWDGVPLDTTVTLPSARPGRLPLVASIHGFGNSKYEYLDPASEAYTGNAYGWARRGLAVLTYTARGLWGSCVSPESRAANLVAFPYCSIHRSYA